MFSLRRAAPGHDNILSFRELQPPVAAVAGRQQEIRKTFFIPEIYNRFGSRHKL